MIQKVIASAKYVIEQYDDAGNLVYKEEHPGTLSESDVAALADNLEAANPSLKTTWFQIGDVSESVYLPGTVVEIPLNDSALNYTLFDVDGAQAAKATLNGVELPRHFYAETVVAGDVVEFFDDQGVLIAVVEI